jgi:tight adherence protein B
METLIYVFVFLATFLAVEGFVGIARGGKNDRAAVQARLKRLSEDLRAPGALPSSEDTVLRDMGRNAFDKAIDGLPNAESTQLLIYRAGAAYHPRRLVLTSLGLAAVGMVLTSMTLYGPLTLSGLLLGVFPYMQLKRAARIRTAKFEAQFPDALELLTRALRAGHSLSFGFQMVGDELPDPVGTEFAHLAEEVKFGQDVNSALRNLAYRVGVEDLPFFVTAIAIQRETGGNLTEILDKLGHVIRERFKLYGKVRGITAMGRMTANMLAFWPRVMVGALYSVNPGYVEPLWTTSAGHTMVLICVALVSIGYVVCRKMAEIKV